MKEGTAAQKTASTIDEQTADLIARILATNNPFPPRLSCFIVKYEACSGDDYSGCHSTRMRDMMRNIVELAYTHPRYEVEPGEYPIALFADIGIVAMTAFADNDRLNESIEDFLKAAISELSTKATKAPVH